MTTPVRLYREVPALDSVQFIVEVPQMDQALQQIPGDPYPYWQSVPFGPVTAVAAMQDLVVVADPRRFGIETFTMHGDTATDVEFEVEARPVTDDLWDAELERRLDGFRGRIESNGNAFGLNVEAELAAIRRRFLAETRPTWLPRHGRRMHVQEGGLVWVESWSHDEMTPSRTWHVFRLDPPGYIGDVELPPRFRPTAIYHDAVLGVVMDEFDVQSVREYAIVPGTDQERER